MELMRRREPNFTYLRNTEPMISPATFQQRPIVQQRELTAVRIRRVENLTAEELAAWSRLQRERECFESPYFRPEFTQAVANICPDVEVAVLFSRDETVGFFPYHRTRCDVALPIGRELSDFHGVIVADDVMWQPLQLLQECGLRAWNFHHLLAEQQPLQPHQYGTAPSPYIDLSSGFEAYRRERRAAGSNRLKQIGRKERKLAREVAPIRFQLHSEDPGVFRTLLEWKSQQYRRSGLFDLFALDWTRDLLRAVLSRQEEAFSGTLSVLYVNDRPAAVELGMRSFGVQHSWFPAYDRSLAAYGPGHILLLRMLQAATDEGIRRVHLGKAEEQYKWSFTSDSIPVAVGAVDVRPLQSRLKRQWFATRERLRQTALRQILRKPARFLQRMCFRLNLY